VKKTDFHFLQSLQFIFIKYGKEKPIESVVKVAYFAKCYKSVIFFIVFCEKTILFDCFLSICAFCCYL